MKGKIHSARAAADVLPDGVMDHRMGRLGVELLTKAALCALLVGLAAGVFAALLGS